MCSGAKKIFDAVGRIISKAWKAVKKYLVYIIIIIAIFYPMLAPFILEMLPSAVAALLPAATGTGIWASATLEALALRGVVGLAIGFMVDKDTAKQVADDVTEAVKGTAKAVTGVVAGAVGGATAGLLSSGLGTALLVGFGIYLLATRKKEDKKTSASALPAGGATEQRSDLI
mgnify:CR=1 FL=1